MPPSRRITTAFLCLVTGLSALNPSAGIEAAPLPDATFTPTIIQACETAEEIRLPRDMRRAMDSVAVVQNGARIGSGVIISENGYLLTAAHIVARARRVAVYLGPGESRIGRIVRADPAQDIALVKIPGTRLKCLPVRPDLPLTGSMLYGLGVSLPGNLTTVVTPARVIGFRAGDGGAVFIQTAADLAPGHSGGPLLNRQGQVVGLISAKMTPRGKAPISLGTSADSLESRLRVVLREAH